MSFLVVQWCEGKEGGGDRRSFHALVAERDRRYVISGSMFVVVKG